MRHWAGAVAGLALGAFSVHPVGAEPAEQGVVVELFTSQGCSSCPPADELLARLDDHDGVIPLALHVDYWDYIGWTDVFGNPQFTKRQKNYARVAGRRMVYTPQMIVGGEDHVVGTHPMDVADLIRAHAEAPRPVSLNIEREGGSVEIRLNAARPVGDAVVQLVRYTPTQSVEIRRGENAGRTVTYTNIVTDWTVIGHWTGTGAMTLEAPAPGADPVVVVVQTPGPGPILAAARLR